MAGLICARRFDPLFYVYTSPPGAWQLALDSRPAPGGRRDFAQCGLRFPALRPDPDDRCLGQTTSRSETRREYIGIPRRVLTARRGGYGVEPSARPPHAARELPRRRKRGIGACRPPGPGRARGPAVARGPGGRAGGDRIGRHPWLTWPEVTGRRAAPQGPLRGRARRSILVRRRSGLTRRSRGRWRRSPAAMRWVSTPPTTTPGRWPRSGRPWSRARDLLRRPRPLRRRR